MLSSNLSDPAGRVLVIIDVDCMFRKVESHKISDYETQLAKLDIFSTVDEDGQCKIYEVLKRPHLDTLMEVFNEFDDLVEVIIVSTLEQEYVDFICLALSQESKITSLTQSFARPFFSEDGVKTLKALDFDYSQFKEIIIIDDDVACYLKERVSRDLPRIRFYPLPDKQWWMRPDESENFLESLSSIFKDYFINFQKKFVPPTANLQTVPSRQLEVKEPKPARYSNESTKMEVNKACDDDYLSFRMTAPSGKLANSMQMIKEAAPSIILEYEPTRANKTIKFRINKDEIEILTNLAQANDWSLEEM
jgi:hypothetical protein